MTTSPDSSSEGPPQESAVASTPEDQPTASAEAAEPAATVQPPYGAGWTPTPVDPSALPPDTRMWAMMSHLGTLLAAMVAMAFMGPLVVMLVKGDTPFVRRHAVESLNFQITSLILLVVGVIALIVGGVFMGPHIFYFFPVGLLFAAYWLFAVIRGSIRANDGEDYRYAINLRFIH